MVEFEVNPIDNDAVLKEVWEVDTIEARTELEDHQIQAVNKISTLAIIFENPFLLSHVKKFMILQKSRKRKSMEEFVSVVKSKHDNGMGNDNGMMTKMLG